MTNVTLLDLLLLNETKGKPRLCGTLALRVEFTQVNSLQLAHFELVRMIQNKKYVYPWLSLLNSEAHKRRILRGRWETEIADLVLQSCADIWRQFGYCNFAD